MRFTADAAGMEQLPNEVMNFGQGPTEFETDDWTIALWHMNGNLGSTEKNENFQGDNGYDFSVEHAVENATGFDGRIDGAYTFAGGAYLEASQEIELTSSFTLEAWANLNSLGTLGNEYTSPFIVINGDGTTVDWGMRVLSDGRLSLSYTGFNDVSTTEPIVSTGQWHYLAVVHDDGANQDRFYVDGEEVDVITGQTGNPQAGGSNEVTWIGRHPNTGGVFNAADGLIDEVRVSSVARTAEEIATAFTRNPELHVKVPLISSAADTPIWVWWGHDDV